MELNKKYNSVAPKLLRGLYFKKNVSLDVEMNLA